MRKSGFLSSLASLAAGSLALLACSEQPREPEGLADRTIVPFVLARDHGLSRLRFSADGRFLSGVSREGRVEIWNVVQRTARQLGQRAIFAVFAPGSERIVIADENGALRTFETASGRETGTVTMTDRPGPSSIPAVSPDGRYALFEVPHVGVVAVEVATGRTLVRLPYEDRAVLVRRLAFTADGGSALIATERSRASSFTRFDLRQPSSATSLRGSRGTVEEFAVSPSGVHAVVFGNDRMLHLLNVATDRVERSFSLDRNESNLPDLVSAVAFSGDGCRVLIGDYDGRIHVWDVARARFDEHLGGHSGIVTDIAVSRDGRWAASSSHDHTVRLYSLPPARNCPALRRPQLVTLREVASPIVEPARMHPLIAAYRRALLEHWDSPSTRQRLEGIDPSNTVAADGRRLAYWMADRAVRETAPDCVRPLYPDDARRLERLAPIRDRASALRASAAAYRAGAHPGHRPGYATIRLAGTLRASDAARAAACDDEDRLASSLVPAIIEHASRCTSGVGDAIAILGGLIDAARASPREQRRITEAPCPPDERFTDPLLDLSGL